MTNVINTAQITEIIKFVIQVSTLMNAFMIPSVFVPHNKYHTFTQSINFLLFITITNNMAMQKNEMKLSLLKIPTCSHFNDPFADISVHKLHFLFISASTVS